MQYAIPYILLICFYGILAIWYHYSSNAIKRGKIVLICALVYLIFFGFRGFCFYDWNAYYPNFQSIPTEFKEALFNGTWYEPGFTLLMVSCKSIYNNYHFFTFVCCLINTILFVRFLYKHIANIPLGFIVFLCMGGLSISTDLLRNSIAMMIFINAIDFIEQRRPVPYYVACILAISFHLSAILYLPLYFFLHKNFGKWVFLGFLIMGNVILVLQIPIFKSIISALSLFLDATTQQHINEYTTLLPSASFQISIGYLERLFTGFLVFWYYERIKEIQNGTMFINSMLIFLILFFALSEFKTISIRLSMLFSFAYIPIWIDLAKCFISKGNRHIYIGILSIYFILKIYSSTNNIIYAYDNVLINADTYTVRKLIYKKNYDGD